MGSGVASDGRVGTIRPGAKRYIFSSFGVNKVFFAYVGVGNIFHIGCGKEQ